MLHSFSDTDDFQSDGQTTKYFQPELYDIETARAISLSLLVPVRNRKFALIRHNMSTIFPFKEASELIADRAAMIFSLHDDRTFPREKGKSKVPQLSIWLAAQGDTERNYYKLP